MENAKENNNLDSNTNVWKKVGFFSNGDYFVYVFKKTEKIVAALYLVSSLIKDSEPLKWELREKGMELIRAALALNSVEPFDKGNSIQEIFSASLEATTLLEIGVMSGIVSSMNHMILVREIDAMVTTLRERVVEDTARAGYVLSDTFFNADEGVGQNISIGHDIGQSRKPLENAVKGHLGSLVGSSVAIKSHSNTNLVPASKSGDTKTEQKKDKKDSRQEAIITILKNDSNLTIKDFAKVITDCSEKTIQRELIVLVEKGVVAKEGERRWSRYSLKK